MNPLPMPTAYEFDCGLVVLCGITGMNIADRYAGPARLSSRENGLEKFADVKRYGIINGGNVIEEVEAEHAADLWGRSLSPQHHRLAKIQAREHVMMAWHDEAGELPYWTVSVPNPDQVGILDALLVGRIDAPHIRPYRIAAGLDVYCAPRSDRDIELIRWLVMHGRCTATGILLRQQVSALYALNSAGLLFRHSGALYLPSTEIAGYYIHVKHMLEEDFPGCPPIPPLKQEMTVTVDATVLTKAKARHIAKSLTEFNSF